MTTKSAPHPHTTRSAAARRQHAAATAAARVAATRRQRRRRGLLWAIAGVVVAAIVGGMMWTARSTSSSVTRTAPDFTLTDTSGASVHLADLRGRNVVLYFSEGAGCQSCLMQMAAIEQKAAEFAGANVTVLPIVMNTADQIRADMAANGVKTPFLIDADGTVSQAYGTLGKGMHAGLPGHSFVLIDSQGVQRWYGEYPSMYLAPADLLTQIRQHLT
jgi:peroxiredoxin